RSHIAQKNTTPFILACQRGDIAYARLLHELGADAKAQNVNGTNALLAAVGAGSKTPSEEPGTQEESMELVNWLIKLGHDINCQNKKGDTVMHCAAYRNFPKVAEFLHSKGADIKVWNNKNRSGRTPLLIAQGFRGGNFKPDEATTLALEKIMRSEGVEPPPAPVRPLIGKKKGYVE
ncbi:MAG: ankyrin repeat domain-containing protein, partial [Lentisphaeraceae bacterium]|nr:ankyrin repeat domain-containing protein [Lentisphaeraceae bacterium]